MVGVTRTHDGYDGFIRYFGMHGATRWVTPIATTGDDQPMGIAQGSRRIFVAGTTTGAFEGTRNHGGSDAFVSAYSLNGRLIWIRQFGTSAEDVVAALGAGDQAGISVIGTTDGDLASSSMGSADAFVLHLSRRGHLLWSTQFGSSGDDQGTCLDAYRPELVCGSTDAALPGQTSAGGLDAYVARLSQADGSIVWLRQVGTGSDDIGAGVARLSFPELLLAGTTNGTFAGSTSAGGTDAFVATFWDASNPSLAGVSQRGTAGDEHVAGLWGTGNGFAFVGGSTDGAFAGTVNTGGIDGWASMLDQPFYGDVPLGTVWTEEFGTPVDEGVFGLSGPVQSSEMANFTYAVGNTDGTFPGETSAGASDAYWSFRFEPPDTFAQDVLLRGLDAANAYAAYNAGVFDGFSTSQATTLAPSYLWEGSSTDPTNSFDLMIAQASGVTVRLWTYSRSGTYFCIQEDAGVVSYGHGSSTDLGHCSGGW